MIHIMSRLMSVSRSERGPQPRPPITPHGSYHCPRRLNFSGLGHSTAVTALTVLSRVWTLSPATRVLVYSSVTAPSLSLWLGHTCVLRACTRALQLSRDARGCQGRAQPLTESCPCSDSSR